MSTLIQTLNASAVALLAAASLTATPARCDEMSLDEPIEFGGGFAGFHDDINDFDTPVLVDWVERVNLEPGRDLNGRELNRPLIGGAQLQAVSLLDVRHPDHELIETYLQGTQIFGVSTLGPVSDIDMVGALFDAQLQDGTAATIRLDSFSQTGDVNTGTITQYEVSYITREMEDFEYLCGVDETNYPLRAIALEGTWNLGEGVRGGGDWYDEPHTITLACERYALAKCVYAGYGPWAVAELSLGGQLVDVPMRPHFQACTRMLRADYCGDGTPHTQDGTAVNFYDDITIRNDNLPWDLEAEWDEDGAICADTHRIRGMMPSCADGLVVRGCGDFSGGALLLSEIEP